MNQDIWHEVVLTSEANEVAYDHLLQHYGRGVKQEEFCFGLWTPSTGLERETAIVTANLLPTVNTKTKILVPLVNRNFNCSIEFLD